MDQPEILEREGFQLKQNVFAVPPDTSMLDPARKRKVTICNLFVNHQLPLHHIARAMEEPYGRVVQVLIEEGVIYERRKSRPTQSSRPTSILL